MDISQNIVQWILGVIILVSSLGVILAKKPVHSCLSFLLTLLTLAALYVQLLAPFIAVIQVLVYAGAILVIFMFVIVLFQDAYLQLVEFKAKSAPLILFGSACAFVLSLVLLGSQLKGLGFAKNALPENFGSVETLGSVLYIDFFFPFEAVSVLFLIAMIGSLYIGKKAN